MATKPAASQERGPVHSLDGWVSEFWVQGEAGATISSNSILQDRQAPRAEPEEDIDVPEPGAGDRTGQEDQVLSRSDTPDATKSGNQESARISLFSSREAQGMVIGLEEAAQLSEALQAQEESKESVEASEDGFPPSSPISASPTEERFEKESVSSLEGEVAEWFSDADIMTDPTEDPDSQDSQEWPPLLSEPTNREVDWLSVEMTGDHMTTEENCTQLNFLPDAFNNSEAENNMSGAAAAGLYSNAHHSPFDRNGSDDVYTVCSPPFADESEAEEEVSIDIMSCQQQWTPLDIRGKTFQASHSANISVSTEQDSTSTLPAVLSAKQQEELLSPSQSQPAPRGANQEATQQVLDQSASPLSTVAMELSNQGGVAAQGSGCVAAVRERHSRAGDGTEGESKQTGGEGGQKESGLQRNRAFGQQYGRGPVKYSTSVQTQEVQTEKYSFLSSKHTRMESDSCDDSQSDSGVSADFSPCSTLEGNAAISTGTPAVHKETPIEREIRRAVEREHSLRRSRGLPSPPTSPEYVEIPLRKTVLCQSITAKAERSQGQDRQFAGKKMQHEINEEAQREQDLVKLGKVPGFYDKGTVREVKERKQLFEAFQKPSDLTLTLPARSKASSWSSASDLSTLENQGDFSSQASTIGGSHVGRIPTQSLNVGGGSPCCTPRGPGFSEGTACQVIILENNLSAPAQRLCHAKPEAKPVTVVDFRSPNMSTSRTGGHGGIRAREQDDEEGAPKENPFFKLRPSANLVKVEQDIREAQERERELHKQRVSLYGGPEGSKGGGFGGGRPVSTGGKCPTLCPTSLNGLTVPDVLGSSSRGGTRPTAARQSVGKLGVWPPAQAEVETINRPEALRSPRTPRQKSPLVQRWELSLVNGHNIEDD